ncbi:hypothetical protein ACLB1Q_08895 [Escherichia coli]
MVAGGAESQYAAGCWWVWRQRVHYLPAMITQARQPPWDRERDGVLGDGAGCCCIEEYEHAKKRGQKLR